MTYDAKFSSIMTAALLGTTTMAAAECADPVKVGVLHSLSGMMAVSETTLKDTMLMLIEELNGLLSYPVQYEGEESSNNVFYTGAAPNQQAIPAVDYFLEELGAEKFALLGTDYVYPRTTNNILEQYLQVKGIAKEGIFVNYTSIGHSDWATIVADVVALGEDGKQVGVISTTAQAQNLQELLQVHADEIADPSRKSVSPVLEYLVASGLPQVSQFLEERSDKNVWQRGDGQFFIAAEEDSSLKLRDVYTNAESAASKSDFTQLKPKGGVRRVIGTALVQFQLSDPDLARRTTAVASIARRPNAEQLAPLLASIEAEVDPGLKARKTQLANFLSASFAKAPTDRIAAINSLSKDTSVEARSVLNQILTTKAGVATARPEGNLARVLDPATAPDAFYAQLVAAGLAPARTPPSVIRTALEINVVQGRVAGIPLARLGTNEARNNAYALLAAEAIVPPLVTEADHEAALSAHVFFEAYDEPNPAITQAAATALASVEQRVGSAQTVDLALDGLSLALIYFWAAMLDVQNLDLHYGQSRILYQISFGTPQGQITTVIGNNSVGKTSLLKALAGRHPASGGTVQIAGSAVRLSSAFDAAQAGIAYVPQGREVFAMMTVLENLETGFACLPKSERFIPDDVFDLFPVLRK